jgi:hypothetical protein
VNKTRIKARTLPAQLLRQPEFGCPVLDVAVGSGAVDVAKFLLEFLGAKPTRETLKMALSSGNFELVRMGTTSGRAGEGTTRPAGGGE